MDGSIRTEPASWPYTTGDIQWNTFNFRYGTVVIRGKVPNRNTGLWPAYWLLGSNCQRSNKYTGDVNIDTCPALGTSGYQEIDILEGKPSGNWGQTWITKNDHSGSQCAYAQAPLDTNYHVWALNWVPNSVTLTLDGEDTGCSYSGDNYVPDENMFLIIQTQTTVPADTGPPNNAYLPAQFTTDYVKVCNQTLTPTQCVAAPSSNSNVMFYDDFSQPSQPAAPTGLKVVVH